MHSTKYIEVEDVGIETLAFVGRVKLSVGKVAGQARASKVECRGASQHSA